jgi:hypothetical protein
MRKKIIKEFDTELKMRRKVWPKIYGEVDRFVKIEHQERYDILQIAKRVFEQMTDADFAKFSINRQVPPNNEPTLF